MYWRIRYGTGAFVLAIILTACGTTEEQPAAPPPPTPQESNLDAYIADHPERPQHVRDAIAAKRIVRDMLLQEVRLVLESLSTEGTQTERLWCDANPKPVVECPANCGNCRGLIVTRWSATIYLKGKGINPLVVDVRMTQAERPNLGYYLANDPHMTYELARAIQAGQVVVGMTVDQARFALGGYPLEETYTCGKKEVPFCDSACKDCTIKFRVQGNVITLDNKSDSTLPRVTRIDPISFP